MSYLTADNLVKHYGTGDAVVPAVKGISFSIDEGEFVAIMGESGSGKSTLLSMMGALNTPTSGRLTVDEIDIYGLTQNQRADFRREFLGFVFQSFQLVTYLTLAENVMLPLVTVSAGKREKLEMAHEALERVGLQGKEKRLPSQVSGGEQERVAIARAIVNEPPILLADEPTGNLDSKTSEEVMGMLKKLNLEGMTIVVVTHSLEAARNSRRILNISDGILDGEDIVVPERTLNNSAEKAQTVDKAV